MINNIRVIYNSLFKMHVVLTLLLLLLLCIGWHTRINTYIGRAGVSFYILVPALHHEAKLVDLTIRMVTEEQVLRVQRTTKQRVGG
jgi:hypothetical protein